MTLAEGLHPGVDWDVYKAIDRVNISNLKEMARSALHYRYRCAHEKDSPTLTLGRAAHVAVLEPERFETAFTVWDEVTDTGRRRPRNGKDWDAFCEANRDKTILLPKEHRFALDIREAVRCKPVARKYTGGEGSRELTMIWTDAATGTKCKGRLDLLTRVDGVDCIVGLKSSRDLDPRRFAQQAATLGYHLQWSYYADGYATITGREPRVVEICVEASPPYDTVVYLIPSEVIEFGRDEYRALLGKLGECMASNRWRGRAENEVLFELPKYLQQDDDEDLEGLELEGDERKRAIDALNEGLE